MNLSTLLPNYTDKYVTTLNHTQRVVTGKQVVITINRGAYAGSIGILELPKDIKSLYKLGERSYSYVLQNIRLLAIAEGKKISIPLGRSSDSVWKTSDIEIVEYGVPVTTKYCKALLKKEPEVPDIFDHFNQPIVVGSLIMLQKNTTTHFGTVTKIIPTGAFWWKAIPTSHASARAAKRESCYTNDRKNVVVIDDQLSNRILMAKLSA